MISEIGDLLDMLIYLDVAPRPSVHAVTLNITPTANMIEVLLDYTIKYHKQI